MSVAPELMIEIVSSVDRELALNNKLRDYRAIGVQECWVVDPEQQTVEVLTLADGGSNIFSAGMTAASAIFDGLAVSVDAIFEE